MSSLVFNSFFDDLAKGAIDCDSDSFKVMLVGVGYTENKDSHTRRSDVTGEITGTGYTGGGVAATVNVTKDTTNDRVDITLGAASWPSSTLTGRKAVYYKSRGGAASADELVAVIDFGADVSTTNGTFSLSASTIRIQN